MTSFRSRYDAVIVGGGHNGLVAAAYLSRAGQSVLLLERNDYLGGAATSQTVFPGVDARLSRYAYLVSLFPEYIARELGLHFTCRRRTIASCTPYRRDGEDRALLLSNVDEARSRDSLRELTGSCDIHGYERLLQLERALARRVWPSLLQPLRTRDEWLGSLDDPDERAAWQAFVDRPLGETVEACIDDDVLRGLVFTDAKIGVFTHPHDPSLLQNRCFILHVIGGGTGEWLVPVGGMGALADALGGAARESGAELVTHASVEAIHLGSQHHSITFLHDDVEREAETTRVLVNAGPHVLARLLGQDYGPSSADEGSVCKVNLLVTRLPRLRSGIEPTEAFAGTVHVGESYEAMQTSYRQAASGQIPDPPPFELYCHTLTDRSILGPELQNTGHHTLTLFGLDMPYRLFESDSDGKTSLALDRYLRALNDVLAEPIEPCLCVDAQGQPCIEIKSPVDLEHELALNRGNIFHGELSWFFAEGAEQPGTWGVETAYERIYVCGSSAIRGGGVSGIPGHNAAMCILEELNVT